MEGISIDKIEFITTDFEIYSVDIDDILELDYTIKDIPVDCSDIDDLEDVTMIPIIESLLLVINNYQKSILNENEIKFDINKKDIAQILFYSNNRIIKMAYINLTTEDYNQNQNNYVDENKLYITIEENF